MKKIANQHGDVLFEEVDSIPKGARKVEVYPGFVIEHGEGVHTHVFEDVEGIEVYEKEGEMFFRVSRPVKVNHEEHGYQTILPGVKKKGLERVWDYESEEARNVID